MHLSRRTLLAGAALAGCATTPEAGAEPDEIIPLWPGDAPGGARVTVQQQTVERENPFGLRDRAITGVRTPTLGVFRPARPDGSALLVIPGGGYRHVVVDKEGYEACRWFAARGVTCFNLLYRLPYHGWAAGPDTALQDAQRAVRLIRAKATDYRIDPARVAILGFSAGGHVAASLALRWDAPLSARDEVDALDARVAAAGLMYPVISMRAAIAHPGSRERLVGLDATAQREAAYSMETRARADAPPFFLLHASDDAIVPVANTLDFHAALRAAKTPADMHIFEEGGHGFGLRGLAGKPVAAWPALFQAWGVRKGVFGA
jgi:acetyl esterase/lipase